MAKQVFKGFKQVYGEFTPQNGYLYFVRTNTGSTDGYLLFNGKKYGSAEDVSDVLNTKIGTLPEGYTNLVDYINDQVTAITSDYATKEEVGTLSGRVDDLEAISAGTRLDTLEAVSAGTRLTDIETSAATWNASAHTHSNKSVLDGITAEKVADWDEAAASAHTHSNKALLDTYAQTEEDLADAVSKKHEHSNKSVLDGITAEKVTAWDEVAESAATKNEVGTLSGRVDAIEADYLTSSDKTALEGTIGTLSGRVDDLEAISADTRLDALEALSGDSHTHDNKDVLDGITAQKVADWDGVAGSADTRISALEAISADTRLETLETSAATKNEVGTLSGRVDNLEAISADTRLATIESGYTQKSDFDTYTGATDTAIATLSGISADTRLTALEAVSGGVQEIVSGDTSVTIGAKDGNNKQTVAVAISSDSDNAVELKSDGIFAGIYYYGEEDSLPE